MRIADEVYNWYVIDIIEYYKAWHAMHRGLDTLDIYIEDDIINTLESDKGKVL